MTTSPMAARLQSMRISCGRCSMTQGSSDDGRQDPFRSLAGEPVEDMMIGIVPSALQQRPRGRGNGGRKAIRPTEKRRRKRQFSVTFSSPTIVSRLRALAERWRWRSNNDQPNISRVVEDLLCHSCGACGGICPEGAIRFEETVQGLLFPSVDRAKCSCCGLCLEVCPGESFGDGLIDMLPGDPFTGDAIISFTGRSNDDRLYSNSQSGGVASELILHALRSGGIRSRGGTGSRDGLPALCVRRGRAVQ